MNQARIQKILLENFINALVDLYTHDVEYIDLIFTPDKQQDRINIIVKEEYMKGFVEEMIDDSIKEEDFNKLIAL